MSSADSLPRTVPITDNLPIVESADYPLSGESIVCFAGEDWWYHHPHSKNHILKRLARHNRVLFVNSITMGLPSVSNPDFFKKIWRKLSSYLRWLRKAPEGLWVMTPINVPIYGSKIARALNRLLLVLQLRLVMLVLNMHKPIVWVAIPTAADIVNSLGRKLLVYQVSDKYDFNEDSALSRSVIRDMDGRLKNQARVVMYSGRKLYEEAEHRHRYFLEQAVDFDRFAKLPPVAPAEIAAIPRPVLGYVGAADWYTMDVPLIEEVSRRRPDWHWVFIGGKSNLIKLSGPNIHFLGPKPYSDLPGYYRHIDVCVLPWNQQNVFTSYGSAIKVREYLASGKPVVIAPLYEYLQTPGVRIYRTVEEFIALVTEALACDTPRERQLRQEAVRDCTWDVRAREVANLFRRLLEGQNVAQAVLPGNRASGLRPGQDIVSNETGVRSGW
ncbi:MAG TPA: glycosyltransferase [Terriglobales bacterium]|nr:glycosyltransferase [Terriglobales bacterium]